MGKNLDTDNIFGSYQKKKNKINEKVNISKFLRHLSEKITRPRINI